MNSPPSNIPATGFQGLPALLAPHDVDPAPVGRHRLLSLTGGGYRGLFTASALAALLDARGIQGDAATAFDTFAGTSIGGLMACALAVGIPARRVMDTIEAHGPEIFKRTATTGFKRTASGPPFNAEALRTAIVECLGGNANTKLRAVERGVVIPSVNWARAEVEIFMSGPIGGKYASDLSLLDVCLATTAAPTYFLEHNVDGEAMLDGGLTANNPDMLAITELIRCYTPDVLANLDVLSIGTAAAPKARSADDVPQSKLDWAPHIADLIIDSQERLASMQASRLLGGHYLRLNYLPHAGEKGFGDLAQADTNTTLALIRAGKRCADEALKDNAKQLLLNRLLSLRQ